MPVSHYEKVPQRPVGTKSAKGLVATIGTIRPILSREHLSTFLSSSPRIQNIVLKQTQVRRRCLHS